MARRETAGDEAPVAHANAGAGDIVLSRAELAELDALPAPQGARY